MSINRRLLFPVLGAAAAALISFQADARAADDPLASWNDGAAKQAIVDFVKATTEGWERQFRSAGRAHRHFRPGRHIVGRASDL